MTKDIIKEFRKKFNGDLRLLSNDDKLDRFCDKEIEQFFLKALKAQRAELIKEIREMIEDCEKGKRCCHKRIKQLLKQ